MLQLNKEINHRHYFIVTSNAKGVTKTCPVLIVTVIPIPIYELYPEVF